MIRICALKTDALPRADQLLEQITFDVGESKREALSNAREEAAAASLAGLWLLDQMAAEAGLSLSDRVLSYEAGGRPYFPDPSIDFSITHTKGLVACALSVNASPVRIGLDAEALGLRTPESMERISARFFCDAERSHFLSSPDERTFLAIWTGKEALCKQSGVGLSGLAHCDSLAPAPSRLVLYSLPDALLTLACPQDAEPPIEVEWKTADAVRTCSKTFR